MFAQVRHNQNIPHFFFFRKVVRTLNCEMLHCLSNAYHLIYLRTPLLKWVIELRKDLHGNLPIYESRNDLNE